MSEKNSSYKTKVIEGLERTIKRLEKTIKEFKEDIERLNKRDCNATIQLCFDDGVNPFAREDLKIVDVGVSDNIYIVESVELVKLQKELKEAKMNKKDTNIIGSDKSHKWYDVPCEMCMGTGKRRVHIYKNHPSLPIAVLQKAEEIFGSCCAELGMYEGAEWAQFVINCEFKGSYKEMITKQKTFHNWVRENFPEEVGNRIVLTVGRT